MGTHLKVLSESYPMSTNITRFQYFSKILRPCDLDEILLSIGRVTEILKNLLSGSIILLVIALKFEIKNYFTKYRKEKRW